MSWGQLLSIVGTMVILTIFVANPHYWINKVEEFDWPKTAHPAPINPPTEMEIPEHIKEGPTVKMSGTGICHKRGSTYYNQTYEYSSYDTIKDCLSAGGRLPKR